MQIVSYGDNFVSYGDNFACNAKTCFLGKNKKNIVIAFGKEIAELQQQCLRFHQLKRIFPTC